MGSIGHLYIDEFVVLAFRDPTLMLLFTRRPASLDGERNRSP